MPHAAARAYTADVLGTLKPRRVVIPCAGSFALAAAARAAGIHAPAILTADVSLYSTAIGRAITRKAWELALTSDQAGVSVIRPLVESGDPREQAVAVLYMLRLLQWQRLPQRAHTRDHLAELLENAPTYLQQLREAITKIANDLRGILYEPRDLWETVARYQDDPQTVLLVDPPAYSSGYEKQFAGLDDVFRWDVPAYESFDPHSIGRLQAQLGERQARTFFYTLTPTTDTDPAGEWGRPWQSVFADKPAAHSDTAVTWVLTNRPLGRPSVSRPSVQVVTPPYRLFDGEVRADSQLTTVALTPAVGQYYRDLFVHRLGSSATEHYVGLLLDGCLFAVVGIHLAAYWGRNHRRSMDARCPEVTFTMTAPHPTYRRLGKLMLACLTSSWLWPRVIGPNLDLYGAPTHFTTEMLTPHPENMMARGFLLMTKRTRKQEGGYQLSYRGAIVDRTPEQTLALWLSKYADDPQRSVQAIPSPGGGEIPPVRSTTHA